MHIALVPTSTGRVAICSRSASGRQLYRPHCRRTLAVHAAAESYNSSSYDASEDGYDFYSLLGECIGG